MRNKLLIFVSAVALISLPSYGAGTRGSGGKKEARVELKAGAAKGQLESLNRTLKEMSLPEMKLGNVKMKAKEAGEFAKSVKLFEADLKNPEKQQRVLEIKNQGLLEVSEMVIQSKAKFDKAKEQSTDAQLVAELPGNVMNILRSALDGTTSVESVKSTLGSILEFSRGEINKKTIEKLAKELDENGIKLEDVIRCR